MAVRKEKVLLELEDRFTNEIARAAAAAALLDKNLKGLDGTALRAAKGTESLGKETQETGRKTQETTKRTKEYTLELALADERASRLRSTLREQARAQLDAADGLRKTDGAAKETDRSINQLTGRLRLLRDVSVTLGPALVPIGAAGIPAIAGLSTQLGLMAGAVGVSVVAFAGLGKGIEALNKAQLAPTAENLAAARLEMERLGPAAEQFVTYLDGITPQLRAIQMTARAGLFPGLEAGIDALLDRGPEVRGVVADIALTLGDLARSGGEALASSRFDDFFRYLDTEAGPLLREFGQTLGNTFEGMANLFVGFSPVTRQFSAGLQKMTADFAAWSRGLETNVAFQDFVAYIRESGPQVVELLGQLARSFVAIVEAAAPIGQALVPVLTQIAEAFADIASSPIGTPLLTAAAGMVAFNRAAGATAVSLGKIKAAGGIGAVLGKVGGGVQLASLLVGMEAIDAAVEKIADRKLDDSDLAALADGQYVDKLGEVGDRLDTINSRAARFASLDWLPGQQPVEAARAEIEKMDEALAGLVRDGRADEAGALFDRAADSAREAGYTVEELRGHFDGYHRALDEAGLGGTNVFAGVIAGAQEATRAILEETEATWASVQAMRAKRQANLAAFDSETAWRQALNEARDAANRNTAGIRGNSQAALANRERLSALAAAWNNQSDAVRNNEARQKAARQAFLRAAEGMGVSSEAARKLAQRVLDIPEKKQVTVTAATDAARSAIESIRGLLAGIPDENVNVYVRRVQAQGLNSGFGPQVGFADGSYTQHNHRAPLPAHLTGQEAHA